jgi:hypothetical protein
MGKKFFNILATAQVSTPNVDAYPVPGVCPLFGGYIELPRRYQTLGVYFLVGETESRGGGLTISEMESLYAIC